MSHSLSLLLFLSLSLSHLSVLVTSSLQLFGAPRILGTLWLNNVIKININDFESRLGIATPPPAASPSPLLLTGGPRAAAVTYRDPLKVEAEVEAEYEAKAEAFLDFVCWRCCCCFYCN